MKDRSEIAALRRRWANPQGAGLAAEILSRLVAGRSIEDLQLQRVDGRWDLRGLAAPTPHASQPKEYRITDPVDINLSFLTLEGILKFENVILEDLDLSGTLLTHMRLFSSVIDNCRFDEADCRDLRLWATDVRNCTFIGADLYDSNVGAFRDGRPNRFHNIDFSRANVAKLSCGVADFIDCDFSFAKVEDINFWQASLIRCKFAGPLRNVIFDGRVLEPKHKAVPNPMEDIDMTDVDFESVDFRGVKFDRIRLPDDPNLVVIRSSDWLDGAIAELGNRDDLAAKIVRGRLENRIKFDKAAGGHSFINLARIPDANAAQLMRELIATHQGRHGSQNG